MPKVTYEAKGTGILKKTHIYINSWLGVWLTVAIVSIYVSAIIIWIVAGANEESSAFVFGIGIPLVGLLIGIISHIDKTKPLCDSKYDWDSYGLYHFETKYMDNIIYKKAFDDCVEEIKNGDFVTDAWEKIFKDLNVELYEIEQQEKKQKIAIDRLDYAKVLKDANKLYLGK